MTRSDTKAPTSRAGLLEPEILFTTALPTMTPSAYDATARACSAVDTPMPTATGRSVSSRIDATSARAIVHRLAHPGDAEERRRVHEAARGRPDRAKPLGRGRLRRDEHRRDTGAPACVAPRTRVFDGEVGHDRTGRSRVGQRARERVEAVPEDQVVVGHRDERPARRFCRARDQLDRAGRALSFREQGVGRLLDDGAVHDRIAERDADLEHPSPGLRGSRSDVDERVAVRVPAHEERHHQCVRPFGERVVKTLRRRDVSARHRVPS